ncbi:MAG: hypothetical protein IKZ04_02245, partial [Spirochaetaceae bacterium]|nr:hypothetical protein [Spirochaetaceae bacterium]
MYINDIATLVAVSVFCGLVFVFFGIWAFIRKDPMHFWAGTTVPAESVKDLKKYNRANGLMWIFASLLFFIAAIICIFDFALAGNVLGIGVP